MQKRIIFIDYDGTLINGADGVYTPTARTRTALRALRRAGHELILSTGRSLCFLEPDVLELFAGSISENGAHIAYGGNVYRNLEIPPALLRELRADLDGRGVVYVLESTDRCTTPDVRAPYYQKVMRYFNLPLEKVTPTADAPGTVYSKFMVFAESRPVLEDIQRRWSGVFDLVPHHLLPCADGMLAGTSKGEGVRLLCERLGILVQQAVAIGDSKNDLEMFQTVGTAIAMRVHAPALDQAAAFVTGSVAEDGVVQALYRLGLFPEQGGCV